MEPRMSPQQNRLAAIKTWIHQHPRKAYLLAAIILIVIAGIIVALFWRQPETLSSTKKTAVTQPEPAPIYYAPLTGVVVKKESDIAKPVTAVMIENSPDARPQSGLKKAEVVYEAVAEGGITRFLALYQQEKPKLIGPVRSVRMYYVDWMTPYNASIAHVGGSARALKLIRSGKYRDIDQFFNPGAYWRVSDRFAPHNVYTSAKKLDSLNKSKGYKTSKPKTIERADDGPRLKQNAKQVNLGISGPLYNSSYKYNKKSKLYARSQGGEKHRDRERGQITAKVVIALKVSQQQVLQDGYRESIDTDGKGKAYIFQNGHAYKAIWHKKSRSAQLSFTDSKGKPLPLARGTTWITAIPNGVGSVSWR